MLFSSLVFLWFFLPAILIACRLLPLNGQNALLLLASLLFYAWGEPQYLLLMLVSITLNYLGGWGIAIAATRSKRNLSQAKSTHGTSQASHAATSTKQTTTTHTATRLLPRLALGGAIAANLVLLGYFKYYTFAATALNTALGGEVLAAREILLPIGISFYTFQAMSYLIDLYRGKIELQKSWFRLALYISFFPQLIAGPIVQYSTIERQLTERTVRLADMSYGAKRFLYGLAKKVILSNAFAAKADEIFSLSPDIISSPLAWLAALYYTLQIYYDFSGYSDMAIGLGRMFGFTFPENFNYPYLARSVTDFWRRWHISLSSWFRNYLYIPLGGNRKGQTRTLCNLFIVFCVTGLWHGANWQFVAWGVGYGMLLVAERLFLGKWLVKLPRVLGHAYTLLCVTCAWVIFRAPGLYAGLAWLKAMFIPTAGSGVYPAARYLDGRTLLLLCIAVLLSGLVQHACPKLKTALYAEQSAGALQSLVLLVLGLLSVMLLVAGTYNPFIYYQF